MPIARRDETPDALSPHLLHLWRRRWALLIPALLVGVAAFAATHLIKEEFTVAASVFVNRLPVDKDDDNAMQILPNPASVKNLLASDALLMKVREEYVGRYGGDRKRMPIELFAKQFRVKSEVLQDTAVRKDISPVLELTVQGTGAEQTRFMMESWLRNAIRDFGGYASAEAVQKRDGLAAEGAAVERQIAEAEAERAQVEAELPLAERTLLEVLATIAPADAPARARETRTLGAAGVARNSSVVGTNTNVTLNMEKSDRPGLVARLAALALEARTAAVPGTAAPRAAAAILAEQGAVAATLADAQTSAAALQRQVAQGRARLDALDRRVQSLAEYQQRLRAGLDRFALAAAAAVGPTRAGGRSAEGSELIGADIRVLSGPVTPELKVWPRRTLTAGAAFLATLVLAAVAVLGMRAMRRAAHPSAS